MHFVVYMQTCREWLQKHKTIILITIHPTFSGTERAVDEWYQAMQTKR